MGRSYRSAGRGVAIVLGANEVGSAIAVALHRADHAVVLIDEADPPWHRRGMAFTDAWYVGCASLDGEEAVFCGSVRSIPTILDRKGAIAATTWSWPGVAAALFPVALVDARMRPGGPSAILVGGAAPRPRAVGVGPGFVVGHHVDVAVETAPGERFAAVVDVGSTAPARPAHDGLRTSVVRAVADGRFFTSRKIGDAVRAGEHVGTLGCARIEAPGTGVLRGLAAPRARVLAGMPLVEVDARAGSRSCFGIDEGPRRIAASVLRALGHAGSGRRAAPPGHRIPDRTAAE